MITTPARRTARLLLDVNALTFRPEAPFTFSAGWTSPVFVDCRSLIAFPRARRQALDLAADQLNETVGLEAFDAVAGAETAGIPYAAWLADRLMLPMLYVRKTPKGFGRNARIEGRLEPGQRVLLVDDLATDGKSKLAFAAALRDAGALVEHVFVLFFYDIYPEARQAFHETGLRLHALATWPDLLGEARARASHPEPTLDAIAAYLADPVAWSRTHGGAG